MKTAIDLPDELLHRAGMVAAQRRTILRESVVRGLDYAIRQELRRPRARYQELASAPGDFESLTRGGAMPKPPQSPSA